MIEDGGILRVTATSSLAPPQTIEISTGWGENFDGEKSRCVHGAYGVQRLLHCVARVTLTLQLPDVSNGRTSN